MSERKHTKKKQTTRVRIQCQDIDGGGGGDGFHDDWSGGGSCGSGINVSGVSGDGV